MFESDFHSWQVRKQKKKLLCVGVSKHIFSLRLLVTLDDLGTASVVFSLPLPAPLPLHLGLICSNVSEAQSCCRHAQRSQRWPTFQFGILAPFPSVTSKTGMQQRERCQRGAGGPRWHLPSPQKNLLWHVMAKCFHFSTGWIYIEFRHWKKSILTSSRLDSTTLFY